MSFTLMESNETLPAEPRRRAKIVATLGPSCNTEPVFRELVRAGLDVARLNFSHGTHPEKLKLIEMVRKVSGEEGKPICILGDLQGPKIRTGRLKNRIPVQLKAGQKLTITPRDIAGTSTLIATTFPTLAENLEPGARILLSDGLIELYVIAVHGQDTECEVVNGGMLGEHKGINLPGIPVRVPSLTAKDEEDLEFAIKSGVDAIAVSFVRTAEDIRLVRHRVAAMGAETWIIAKLEKPEAIDNLDEILAIADGVMVARGDLGVEMNPERVPVVQKQIILKARDALKPVITATQMLDSMQKNPRPTRAEASDVANAVFDGTDALMLSGETASGLYPLESVEMMSRIIVEAEASVTALPRPVHSGDLQINEAIAEAICHAAEELQLKAIAVFTETGGSAALVSKYRPRTPIIGFSPERETRRKMALYWNVFPRSIDRSYDIDTLAASAEKRLLEEKLVKKGDIVGIIAGTPLATQGTTNLMRLIRIGA